ncbi:MAG: GerMN domain-containing protein [Candidatus Eisenbacteria bacterium]
MNKSSRLARAALLTGALVVLVLVGVRWWASRAPRGVVASLPADSTQAGMRSMTLYFPDPLGERLMSETREMLEQETLHERTAQLVQALGEGPTRGGVTILPTGTAVMHAYLDDQGLLTLDLTGAFRQAFTGGARTEELAVGSLLRTLSDNLPEVKRVQLICGGTPITSLAGHLPLDRPLDPHDWP